MQDINEMPELINQILKKIVELHQNKKVHTDINYVSLTNSLKISYYDAKTLEEIQDSKRIFLDDSNSKEQLQELLEELEKIEETKERNK